MTRQAREVLIALVLDQIGDNRRRRHEACEALADAEEWTVEGMVQRHNARNDITRWTVEFDHLMDALRQLRSMEEAA